MIEHDENYLLYCRVCGLRQPEPPWGEYGDEPTYNICCCCGAEAGYDDWTVEETKKYREQWLKSGTPWWRPKYRPEGWKLEEQLKHIPQQFL